MINKLIIGFIWLVFVAYVLLLAPLDQPGNLTLMEKLITFQLSEVNPIVTAIFWLMGVWPMIYAALLFIDERLQTIPAMPAFLMSNGAGIIGLCPYLILRQPNQEFIGQKNIALKILDSRFYGWVLTTIGTGLVFYAIFAGDWSAFLEEWKNNAFVHLISLDFCLMWLLFPSLLGDDMARRGLRDSTIFWAVSLVPLLGAMAYLCLRPSLQE